ncbi:MAG TPA: hypothetical protein VF469_16200 [Kofleriaceae bacterium]
MFEFFVAPKTKHIDEDNEEEEKQEEDQTPGRGEGGEDEGTFSRGAKTRDSSNKRKRREDEKSRGADHPSSRRKKQRSDKKTTSSRSAKTRGSSHEHKRRKNEKSRGADRRRSHHKETKNDEKKTSDRSEKAHDSSNKRKRREDEKSRDADHRRSRHKKKRSEKKERGSTKGREPRGGAASPSSSPYQHDNHGRATARGAVVKIYVVATDKNGKMIVGVKADNNPHTNRRAYGGGAPALFGGNMDREDNGNEATTARREIHEESKGNYHLLNSDLEPIYTHINEKHDMRFYRGKVTTSEHAPSNDLSSNEMTRTVALDPLDYELFPRDATDQELRVLIARACNVDLNALPRDSKKEYLESESSKVLVQEIKKAQREDAARE